MSLDPVTNFAIVEVSTGYDDSATAIILSSGGAAKLPDPSADGEFNLVWWNSTDYPNPSDDPNVEIVRVTAIATETLTVTRNQESSGASTKNEGGKTYKMALTQTKLMIDNIKATYEDGGISFSVDGAGSVLTTGIKVDLEIKYACEIQEVTLLADVSGSIVIDMWKDSYANFPPTDADSITASAPPTITTATKSQDSTLTGWTTTLAKGDILRFNIDSVTDIKRIKLSLKVKRI